MFWTCWNLKGSTKKMGMKIKSLYFFWEQTSKITFENFRNLSLTQLLNNKVKKECEKLDEGIFLRPVPVTSPPTGNGRFAKRSSVDSGINMDIRTRSGKYFKDAMKLQG